MRLYPFHVQYVSTLQLQGYLASLRLYLRIPAHRYLPEYILFTYEAQFTRDGIDNRHNCQH